MLVVKQHHEKELINQLITNTRNNNNNGMKLYSALFSIETQSTFHYSFTPQSHTGGRKSTSVATAFPAVGLISFSGSSEDINAPLGQFYIQSQSLAS